MFWEPQPPILATGCRDRFSCAGMSVELVIWTFANPPVNTTAQKKTWGGEQDIDRVIYIVMTNTKVGVIPLGET